MALVTLKRRPQFQRVRGGGRWATAVFVLEAKARVAALVAADAGTVASGGAGVVASGSDGDRHVGRDAGGCEGRGPRFGFTVTKKIGNAVVRNRVRRRLKAAVTNLQAVHARPGFDYVIIARDAVVERPFAELERDLGEAFRRVHGRQTPERPPERRPRREK